MGEGIIARRGSEYTTIKFEGTQTVSNVSTNTSLSEPVAYHQGASVGSYAIFAGGMSAAHDQIKANVNAFNTNGFARITPSSLSEARTYFASASTTDYAYFAGGQSPNGLLSSVDMYDKNLIRQSATPLNSTIGGNAGIGTWDGTSAIFAGGSHGSSYNNAVYKYQGSVATELTPLNYYTFFHAASRNKNYVIFAGGLSSSDGVVQIHDTVNAYDSNFTRVIPSDLLSEAKTHIATATAGDYALFVAGRTYTSSPQTYTNRVDAYDLNLVRTVASNYYSACEKAFGASAGGNAVFTGGTDGTYTTYATSVYSPTLVHTYTTNYPHAAARGAATSVENLAVLSGGYFGNDYWDTVVAYGTQNKVQVYPGTKYKFGSMTNEATSSTMQTITTEAPISGYIKIKNTTIN